MQDRQEKTRPVVDSPAAWFAALEVARRRQDHEAAARAIQELRRLGVTVRFQRPRQEAAHAR
jgi:hypothetical protein